MLFARLFGSACRRCVIAGLITVPLALFATVGGLTAQQHHENADDHQDVGVGVDRVLIGPEFLPRRTELSNKLIVPAGQTVELPADATYDYVEVAGTLRASRAHDTTTRFTHLVVLPGGTLDVGTQADPIPCGRKVEFVVRDVPLDTTKDPFQWGNGLVNFGRQTRVGCSKTAWTETAGSLPVGASTLTLASVPSAWQVGDDLLIPDTAAPPTSTLEPRREAKVTISAINGSQLSLSKPLDFAHENISDPNGVVVLRPRVANLTRNIVIRSENPDGTRGHTADVGRKAVWDIRYNQLIGLGRTTRLPLDDTVLGRHVGTNQRGKYAEHHHHAQSAPTSADVGNVYIGPAAGKWGLVLHDTSDTLVERNIAIDFPGAGFITEDGYEVRNKFRNNFAAYNLAKPRDAQRGLPDANVNVAHECPGCEGTGFWFRGIMNAFEGNEAWNNFGSGINLFNQKQPAGKYPSAPGGEPDSALRHYADQPVSLTGNVAVANVGDGFEVWGLKRFPNQNLIAAHNTYRQAMAIISEGVEVYLQNPKLICSVGTGAVGLHSANGYVSSLKVEQGQIAGCAVGISGGGSGSGMTITGTVLQNEVNVDVLTPPSRFENVMHVPLANYPHRYILLGNGAVWNGSDPLPEVGIILWFPQRGSRYVVKNWQGTGKDYLLFSRQSLGSSPAWYSASGPHIFNTPVQGLTMQQSWDRFGLSFGGDVLRDSDAVPLDGLVNGFAREGLGVNYSPPRAIVTFPTMRETAKVEGGAVHVYALLTGDPNAASGIMMVSVDGERPYPLEKSGSDDRSFTTNHTSPGVHEIKVWRTQKAHPNDAIPGTEYASQYCVGPCPAIPHGHISLSSASLTFAGATRGASPAAQPVTVSNSGRVGLIWAARPNQNWCKLNLYNGRLAPGGSVTFSVSVDPPSPVAASVCTVAVVDNNADNSPQTITVNYAVSE
jgi:hypothetical protein